jgi:glutamate dehydrogenase (NAD(P)+)
MGRCYLVLDRLVSGRCWGGFRVAENLSVEEVRVLARTMTMKTLLAGIPIGGAKGGISLSNSRYSREEMLRLASSFVGPYIKRRTYFLGTDIGFTESDVDFVYRSVHSKQRLFTKGMTVGEACATGILVSLGYLERTGIHPYGPRTVALEGFGRIGLPTAKLLSKQDFRIVAVSNLAGTLHDPSGLDVSQLLPPSAGSPEELLSSYAKNHPGAIILPREALTHVECEILVPGARASVVDAMVAREVRARVVCPISNAPVTLDGEEVLARAGIISMPDLITNVGALIASFAQHLGADFSQTKRLISSIISRNLDSVFENYLEGEIPKKKASAMALLRLEEIEKSESITSLKFLSPWIHALGARAILNGFREYLGIRFRG